jgi:hypothetical protein
MKVPGPGTYGTTTSINPTGKSHVSTVPSSKAANWSPSKVRFQDENHQKRHIPGPGTYNAIQEIGQKSRLSTSKNPGSPRMQPDMTRDKTKVKSNNVPGPGTYILPSDFGHLEFHKKPRKAR